MTEKPEQYRKDDGQPFSDQKTQTEILAQSFIDGIQGFHWKADFVRFCQILGLEADEYADHKYRSFQELVERLNEFDAESLAKMMDWGNPTK
jgi:hypothetical protein